MLAEIIKASPVPHTALLNIIYDFRVEPQWLEVSRPPGRSPQECRLAFDQLRAGHPPSGTARPPPTSYPAPTQFIQRQFVPPEGPGSSLGSRNIQPRPEGVPHSVYPSSGSPYSLQPPDQPLKKRGRPSNAELELRKQEYEARGEPYPPPRSRKRSKAPRGSSATSPKISRVASGSTSAEVGSGGSSQRASYAGPSEPSPTTAVPGRRSPGTMEPPMNEQRPPTQPHHARERSYSQSRYAPSQAPHQTPPQPSSQSTPQHQPPNYHPRLPSPSSFHHGPSHGFTVSRALPSPHTGGPPPSGPPTARTFPQNPDPLLRRSSPARSSGEPMEH